MMRALTFGTLVLSTISASAHPTPMVNCNQGESLNRALARIEKFEPVTVTFTGTCREYVLVDGFTHLTLKGEHGASIQQPDTPPPATPPSSSFVLSVKASHSVIFSGFAVHSQPTVSSSIGIGGGSSDVHLRDITSDGAWGVWVYEASQVWLIGVTVNLTSGYAALSAFDKSDVHIVNGLLHRPADGNFDAGLFVASGHVTVQGLTIRDMQQGIVISSSGSVDIGQFHATNASTDVTVENPSGTNYNGATVMNTSSLNVGSARLVITNAGQPWGGDTGGVLVSNGSTLTAGSNLVVSGSQSQGVVVSNNSHADFGGSSITGNAHGGLVVVNSSTATADTSNPLTDIGSNGTDLFCDSHSQIAGAQNIANATAVHCQNLLPGPYKSLP
jgi:hypothetical protein